MFMHDGMVRFIEAYSFYYFLSSGQVVSHLEMQQYMQTMSDKPEVSQY